MHIQEGHWTCEKPLFPSPDGFKARVQMTGAETNALAFSDDYLPPSVLWCLTTFERSGWTFAYEDAVDDPDYHLRMTLYFASHDDALAFYMRWS